MQRKVYGKQEIAAGIRNAFGFGRRRGGASAVAAALAVCAIIASIAVSAVGEAPQEDVSNDDVFFDRPDGNEPVPWEKTVPEEPVSRYHGATPSRLPC